MGEVMLAASLGGVASQSPWKVSRQTCAGMRGPSRTRSSMYHFGTGWKRGNHVNESRTHSSSSGSESCSTSLAKGGRPCRLRGDPTSTSRLRVAD